LTGLSGDRHTYVDEVNAEKVTENNQKLRKDSLEWEMCAKGGHYGTCSPLTS